MIPMVNIQPFGTCIVTGSACMPVPIMWEGFEDGVFIGEFNPLLEDSVLQCGVGGRIKIYYSLAEAQAACPVPGMSMLEMLGTAVLVVAAVGLVVLSGGAIIAAVRGNSRSYDGDGGSSRGDSLSRGSGPVLRGEGIGKL